MVTIMAVSAAAADGVDDATLNELIRAMLAASGGSAHDHAVWAWRRDNYLDLRRWAAPAAEEYIAAQARIAAGGMLALEGQARLNDLYRRRLSAELSFPENPHVPAVVVDDGQNSESGD
jgi:uncharacterized membrane protein YebE (DUF533 family)